jgi:hypothetical protein
VNNAAGVHFLQICPFPIFTRSGEVNVKLELSGSAVVLTPDKLEKIVTFLNYTFTSVLRLQKYLMMFDPQASENSYFIVPTKKCKPRVHDLGVRVTRISQRRFLRCISSTRCAAVGCSLGLKIALRTTG